MFGWTKSREKEEWMYFSLDYFFFRSISQNEKWRSDRPSWDMNEPRDRAKRHKDEVRARCKTTGSYSKQTLNIYSVQTGQVHRWRNELKWNISNLTGKWDDWIFTLKQPFHKVKGVSHLPFLSSFTRTLALPFLFCIWNSQSLWAGLLCSPWNDRFTRYEELESKNVQPHLGSHFQPSWAAALLIARQILIYLWTDYLCMLVRTADAVIAPYSCGNN